MLSPKPRTKPSYGRVLNNCTRNCSVRERLPLEAYANTSRGFLPPINNIPGRMSKASGSALAAHSHARGNCKASCALAKGERSPRPAPTQLRQPLKQRARRYIHTQGQQATTGLGENSCGIKCGFLNATHDSRRLRSDETFRLRYRTASARHGGDGNDQIKAVSGQ